MIKIKKIFSLDGTERKISDLKADYLTKLTSDGSLSSAIQSITVNNSNQIAIIDYLKKKLDKILLAKPSKLKKIIDHFTANNWHSEIYTYTKPKRTKLTIFGNDILTAFDYDAFRTSQTKGKWLAEMLNIKSCPYCNAHYTLTIQTEKKVKAKFQLDHFYYKKKFPYLSLSLYNLIPCCANCNLSKGARTFDLLTHYHPYYSSLHTKSKFMADPAQLLTAILSGDLKSHPLDVKFVSAYPSYDTLVKNHDKIFDINPMYDCHQDIAQELFIKSITHTKMSKEDILAIQGLFPDEETYLKYLLGNYPYKDQMLKRPLAKYVQDLAQQFKLL